MSLKKKHTVAFKSQVALDAISERFTVAELVSKYQVSTSLIYRWKKQLTDQAHKAFSPEPNKLAEEHDANKLLAKIGKLTVENDFLQQAWNKMK